jgi:DsbC/DsbD-like thiol-disulfide interchange protein
MRIDEQHVAEPGLVVLDVTAADEDTIRAVMDGLQQQWATSGVTPVWRTPGEAGVRARVYADIRRPGTTD